MASVDDIEELIATRKLNGIDDGLYKESDKNVANKIKRQVENAIRYYKNIDNIEEVPIDILRAMYKDLLAELEQNKKRIKELDADLTTAYLKGYADAEEKYRQKIKDKIEEYDKKMTENKGNPNWVVTDRIVMNVLEELLEEK